MLAAQHGHQLGRKGSARRCQVVEAGGKGLTLPDQKGQQVTGFWGLRPTASPSLLSQQLHKPKLYQSKGQLRMQV